MLAQGLDIDTVLRQVGLDLSDRGAVSGGRVLQGCVHLAFIDLQVELASLLELKGFFDQRPDRLLLNLAEHRLVRANARRCDDQAHSVADIKRGYGLIVHHRSDPLHLLGGSGDCEKGRRDQRGKTDQRGAKGHDGSTL